MQKVKWTLPYQVRLSSFRAAKELWSEVKGTRKLDLSDVDKILSAQDALRPMGIGRSGSMIETEDHALALERMSSSLVGIRIDFEREIAARKSNAPRETAKRVFESLREFIHAAEYLEGAFKLPMAAILSLKASRYEETVRLILGERPSLKTVCEFTNYSGLRMYNVAPVGLSAILRDYFSWAYFGNSLSEMQTGGYARLEKMLKEKLPAVKWSKLPIVRDALLPEDASFLIPDLIDIVFSFKCEAFQHHENQHPIAL
jgi:hypothetical protein